MGMMRGVFWEWNDAGRFWGMGNDAGVFWEWGMMRAFSGNGMMWGVFYYCLILSDINN